ISIRACGTAWPLSSTTNKSMTMERTVCCWGVADARQTNANRTRSTISKGWHTGAILRRLSATHRTEFIRGRSGRWTLLASGKKRHIIRPRLPTSVTDFLTSGLNVQTVLRHYLTGCPEFPVRLPWPSVPDRPHHALGPKSGNKSTSPLHTSQTRQTPPANAQQSPQSFLPT